jgi:hypothetical protein
MLGDRSKRVQRLRADLTRNAGDALRHQHRQGAELKAGVELGGLAGETKS